MHKRRYGQLRRRAPRALIPPIRPNADPRLGPVFASIGVPDQRPFQPDPFQLKAVAAIERADCLVTAPTGSGKTWIAERAIAKLLHDGKRSWYASPLKALSNSKYGEFARVFGAQNVGILTGDRKENADAPIVVGTTEILRNQLYDAMYAGQDLPVGLVVLDEAHFLGDRDRGVVWEEVMIYLPRRIPLLMLSATIGNADQIAKWLSSIRQKDCVVVEEAKRPVDLSLLFLHPSGTLCPLLSPDRPERRPGIDRRVKAYVQSKNPPMLARPRELPPFGEILRVLRTYHLLPAIFFLKSRSECDRALSLCEARDSRENARLSRRIGELIAAHPYIADHPQLAYLAHRGVGAHHAGQLALWKLALEALMTEGLLDAIFATSTVAAGVNFPARTVVFVNSDRFDGHGFVPLTPTEFHQMVGRAGRRGMDRVGFAVVVPGTYMDIPAIARLATSPPSDVLSQIKLSFSMVLNLLLSHTPREVEGLFERSLGARVQAQERTTRALVGELRRYLDFLRETGYVTPDGRLTDAGRWASQLRVDQPLVIAEGLRLGILPRSHPALLAALVAAFAHERGAEDEVDERMLTRDLERAFITVKRGLGPYMRRLAHWEFGVRPLSLRGAAAVHAWARGWSWDQVVSRSGMTEGDLAMLVARTADNLRHIRTLTSVFPQAASSAGQAVELIMREPVVEVD